MDKHFIKSGILIIFTVMISALSCNNKEQHANFSFIQMCDPQFGMGGYHHDTIAFKEAIEQINQINPDFVVICGDLVDSANDNSIKDFIRIKSKFNMPVYLAAGNHDVENVPTLATLDKYRSEFGKDYYSFDYQNYIFIIINTQLWKSPVPNETEAQDKWLAETLNQAKEKNKPVIVIGHYPLFIERPDEIEDYFNLPIKKRLELMDLFQENKVVAYLGGHVHKTLVNKIEGIQFVNGETTSMNFDNRLLGFRQWTIKGDSVSHKFIELANPPEEEKQYNPDYQTVTKDTLKN